MENEKVLAVLTEMLDDQKDNTKMLITLKSSVEELEARLDLLNENIYQKPSTNETIDSEFKNLILKKLDELKKNVESFDKKSVQEKRFLLFPEHNAKEYYSVVLKWILYITIATYCYWLFKDLTHYYK